ncbi:MAG: hypothetical protein P4L99_05930 [Chthoniobacter sp.]|nr:hypothetical protein [Chthoniobacter sp.]
MAIRPTTSFVSLESLWYGGNILLSAAQNGWWRKSVILLLALWAAFAHAEGSSQPSRIKEPELRLELLSRDEADQQARTAIVAWLSVNGKGMTVNEADLSPEHLAEYQKLSGAIKKSDQENTERLGEIIEKYGWPTKTLVGRDGSHAAWLLVQHADDNTKFQRKCLDLMTKLPHGEVSQSDVAYLTDRVLLAEGKKQIYGTQFTFSDAKWVPQTLEDEANVDKRRAEVGLPPLAEYVKSLESVYGSAAKK